MKKLVNLLILLIPAMLLQGQVSDYCGILKLSLQNVQEVNNGLEFEVYLRSGKQSAETCGDLYLGQTDVWVKMKGGDFSKAKVEKLGESSLVPSKSDATNNMFTQMTYHNGTSAKVLDGRVVLNINAPASNDATFMESNVAKLDDKPRTYSLGKFRVTDYETTVTPQLILQNLDKGQSVERNRNGYDKFCSKSHTLNHADGKTISYAVQVVLDEFLRDKLAKFSAEKEGKSSAKLDWKIDDKGGNIKHYELERSKDGKNWEKIGEWEAGSDNYRYIDQDIYDGKSVQEMYYYRLRMESDMDYDYSEEKLVVFTNVNVTQSDIESRNSGEGWMMYPNPSVEGIHVEIGELGADQYVDNLVIYSMSGKLIYRRDINAESNKEYIDYREAGIGSGMYLLQLRMGDNLIGQDQIDVIK